MSKIEDLNLESLQKMQGEDLGIDILIKALENEVILLKGKIAVLENKTGTLKYNDIKDILIEGQKRETYNK